MQRKWEDKQTGETRSEREREKERERERFHLLSLYYLMWRGWCFCIALFSHFLYFKTLSLSLSLSHTHTHTHTNTQMYFSAPLKAKKSAAYIFYYFLNRKIGTKPFFFVRFFSTENRFELRRRSLFSESLSWGYSVPQQARMMGCEETS